MRMNTRAARSILGCAALILTVAGCRRVGSQGADRPLEPGLRAKEAPRPRATADRRPVAAAPARGQPPDRRKAPKAGPPIIKPQGPAPEALDHAGAEPRLTLRYRFSNGEKLRWRATMEQVTRVRKEERCPTDLKAQLRGAAVRTIPMGYGADLITVVTRAPDELYQLDTRLSQIKMTLPPALESQRKLLLTLLSNLSYTRRMSRRGQITRFRFGKLTPRSLVRLSERLQAPLNHLHPMLPAAAVGVGARWRRRRLHTLQKPGGRIDSVYTTGYRLTALRTQGGQRVVDLEMSTRVKMSGKLMGNDFTGHGSGTARLTLDAARGVILKSGGTLLVCSAVKGRTSTNRTVFSQTLKSADTPPAKAPATPPAKAPATPPAKAPATPPAPGMTAVMKPAPAMGPATKATKATKPAPVIKPAPVMKAAMQ